MPAARDVRNVGVLAACQALFMSSQSMHIIAAGLVGAMLAENRALATVPVTAVVVATVATTIPASLLMHRLGRQTDFMLAAVIGALGGALAAWGIWVQDFWVFVAGAFGMGVQGGFAQYYRFAAADVASPEFRARAISLTLSGGVVSALVGPQLAKWTTDLFAPVTFLGVYVTVCILAASAVALLMALDIPKLSHAEVRAGGRPLIEIARQPTFLVAVLCGMVGYGVMSLVMTSTPLAMVGCGFGVVDAATVIQFHVLAMFAPSFFTGTLIDRFGVLNVILFGMALLAAYVAVALAGIDILNFGVALTALGLGWNFAFVGASTLLTETYEPAERAKVQAANDFLVFGSVALASASSGAVLHLLGWDSVQMTAVPFVVTAVIALVWLKVRRAARAGTG